MAAKSYFVYAWGSGDNSTSLYYPWVEISVEAWKRNFFCVWNTYENVITYKNVSFSINSWVIGQWGWDGPREMFSRAPADFTSSNIVRCWPYNGPVGALVTDYTKNSSDFRFDKIHVEATTQGVNGNWAIIDCQ